MITNVSPQKITILGGFFAHPSTKASALQRSHCKTTTAKVAPWWNYRNQPAVAFVSIVKGWVQHWYWFSKIFQNGTWIAMPARSSWYHHQRCHGWCHGGAAQFAQRVATRASPEKSSHSVDGVSQLAQTLASWCPCGCMVSNRNDW